jgi:hypothetical protein
MKPRKDVLYVNWGARYPFSLISQLLSLDSYTVDKAAMEKSEEERKRTG